MNTPEERQERDMMVRHLEKAMKLGQDIAKASYCLERAVLKIAEGLTEPKMQPLRETLLNAIEFARSKLPELPDELPEGMQPTARGRTLKTPVVSTVATVSDLVIGVEDESKPSFWFQMVLPVWFLHEQLGLVELLRQRELAGGG